MNQVLYLVLNMAFYAIGAMMIEIKFKCPNCDIKYNTEDLRNNCDSWISELCVKSISLKQWRYQNARD
jgi:hypothetical protein